MASVRGSALHSMFWQVLECLRDHRNRLSTKCHGELFSRDQLAMADSRMDFKLMSACKAMIRSHCNGVLATGSTLLKCLKVASNKMGDVFDPYCRRVILNRLQTQYLDNRLNPRLISNCR